MAGTSGTRSLRMTFRMPAGALSALMTRVSTEQSSHAPLAEALPRNGTPATPPRPSLAQVCVGGGRVCLSVCVCIAVAAVSAVRRQGMCLDVHRKKASMCGHLRRGRYSLVL
jgi:hypothetical protein